MQTYKFDVVVVGAGPAGIAAAVAAAREGAKVALLERYGCVGGGLTAMFVRPLLGYVANPNLGNEIEDRIGKYTDYMTTTESAKCALMEILHEADVTLLLQTPLVEVESIDGRVVRAYAQGRGDKICLEAKQFVDASGDGDLAALAGCKFEYGRPGDGLVQPVSLMFTIEGIAPEAQSLLCYHEEHETMLPCGRGYLEMCHEACRTGELPPSINIVRLYDTGRPDERTVNATQVNHVNTLSVTELSEAEYTLREQMKIVVDFLHRRVPGFEHVRVNGSAFTIGVRESRRIVGDYTLTGADLVAGRKFPDAIVHDANFCIDIHNPDGSGQSETDGIPHLAQDYDIPYRALCPVGMDNLLVAGRCISGEHRACASYRVMRICMAMGQATGLAAADAAIKGVTTREVDLPTIQQKLHIVPIS